MVILIKIIIYQYIIKFSFKLFFKRLFILIQILMDISFKRVLSFYNIDLNNLMIFLILMILYGTTKFTSQIIVIFFIRRVNMGFNKANLLK